MPTEVYTKEEVDNEIARIDSSILNINSEIIAINDKITDLESGIAALLQGISIDSISIVYTDAEGNPQTKTFTVSP